jgi:hypothetical protein
LLRTQPDEQLAKVFRYLKENDLIVIETAQIFEILNVPIPETKKYELKTIDFGTMETIEALKQIALNAKKLVEDTI